MERLVLTQKDIMKILCISRTSSYEIVNNIKAVYPSSNKLIGARVTIKDFANSYDFEISEINACIGNKS